MRTTFASASACDQYMVNNKHYYVRADLSKRPDSGLHQGFAAVSNKFAES